MKSKLQWVAVLAILFLAGCATQGPREELQATMPNGNKTTIVVHNQSVPDWLLKTDSLKHNYMVRGATVGKDQLVAVAESERVCRDYAQKAQPSAVVSVLANGALYGIAGAIGIGVGSQAFKGAQASDYAEYGAWAGGASGAAGGLVSSAAARVYAFQVCGRDLMGLNPEYGIRIMR